MESTAEEEKILYYFLKKIEIIFLYYSSVHFSKKIQKKNILSIYLFPLTPDILLSDKVFPDVDKMVNLQKN